MPKVLNVNALLNKTYTTMPFEGRFYNSFGQPEVGGNWTIYGKSGNGKTSLMMQLMKYMSQWLKIDFFSLEERDGINMQRHLERENMREAKSRVSILIDGKFDDLVARAERNAAADAFFIDSIQYMRPRVEQYQYLKETFPNKLFVWIAQADGDEPRGQRAKDVLFDSNLKIHVKGFGAFTTGRVGVVPQPFVIWEEPYNHFWAKGVLNQSKK